MLIDLDVIVGFNDIVPFMFSCSENKANPTQCESIEKPWIDATYTSLPQHNGISSCFIMHMFMYSVHVKLPILLCKTSCL